MAAEIFIKEIFKNQILVTSMIALIIAQTIKVIIGVIIQKRFDFRWFMGTGGMPSAHAAGVTALATSVGMYYGFDSVLFAISLVFAVIVSFDAQGVRRTTGRQAVILNKILDDLYWKKVVNEEKIKEFLGHTPFEVFVGVGLGALIAFLRG